MPDDFKREVFRKIDWRIVYTDLGEQPTIFNFPVILKKLISNGEKVIKPVHISFNNRIT
jgi:hypothetical protein